MAKQDTSTTASPQRKGLRLPPETGIFVILALIMAGMEVLTGNFLTIGNISTLLVNTITIGLLAVSETFVLLIGGIDLSVGAIQALSGVTAAVVINHTPLGWPGAILGGILAGALIGFINGSITHYINVPAFITTFATLGVAASIPLIVTQANPIPIFSNTFNALGQGYVLKIIPIGVLVMLVVAAAAHVVLSRTAFGVKVYAVGGNRHSAWLAGVNIARIEILCFTLSGTIAGLAGVILAARLASGYPTAGSGASLFDGIASAVVGGVSLFGGSGSVAGALLGAIVIGTLTEGMDVLDLNTYWQPLVIGIVILLAVMLDTWKTGLLRTLMRRLRRA
ncbi:MULTISPECIES: ABC transporter permease [Acidiphilium]|jgi:ribose transport system permease protein|uniref:Monosaccharide ABC transporter membrane protein, CUT2 family n=3 Tax=Acidiphilium TaxID=522 RepID=A5FVU7_ACICJ|nr:MULTISPECIES: ABC transporter permease [Acidiphilium]KDM67556.1 ribose transport system permease protein RbsC [Acidiphilium sp. JA12-A1]MBU6355537.1 ABC transporter permease [Rhodospirillales bacterium]ABQ29729.1 monosaccharide ABC transporter membrane protein, CUT2 family [Acidiphilium cryptum JF-5]EGO96218.1 Monosaccharide-transporting ATPase [Acidiphilium sp. PM]MBS3023879.1 ABC transporter permease [Acidiphilium multivorum]